MIRTNSVFVVEGISDRALLSRFFDTEIVTTNGSYVSRETIHYIVGLKNNHDIIIITDPDGPGKEIARKVLLAVPTARQVEISKQNSIRKGKVGLAETDIDLLIPKILPLLSPEQTSVDLLSLNDLIGYERHDVNFRTKIQNTYPIGKVNNKTMIKRLTYLGITKEMVDELIYG